MSPKYAGVARVAWAALVAPLVPSIVLVLISLLTNPLEGLWATVLIVPLSYAMLLLPGLPLYILFRNLSWDSAGGCMVIGVICSTTASALIMRDSIQRAIAVGGASAWGPFVSLSTFAGILGLVSGYVFWRVSRQQKTDVYPVR